MQINCGKVENRQKAKEGFWPAHDNIKINRCVFNNVIFSIYIIVEVRLGV